MQALSKKSEIETNWVARTRSYERQSALEGINVIGNPERLTPDFGASPLPRRAPGTPLQG